MGYFYDPPFSPGFVAVVTDEVEMKWRGGYQVHHLLIFYHVSYVLAHRGFYKEGRKVWTAPRRGACKIAIFLAHASGWNQVFKRI